MTRHLQPQKVRLKATGTGDTSVNISVPPLRRKRRQRGVMNRRFMAESPHTQAPRA